MDINEIKKLIKVFENAKVTELLIQEGNLKIKISKNGKSINNVSNPQNFSNEMPISNQISTTTVSNEPIVDSKKEEDDNTHIITSPIVGTFYRAPAPDADPYIQVGDSISQGSVLGIVEAMKLMNEIESDISGKILQILVENGTAVEFNQPLFKIKKN